MGGKKRPSIDALLVLPPYAWSTAADYYPSVYFLANHLRQHGYSATVLDLNRRLPNLLLRGETLDALIEDAGTRKRELERQERLSPEQLNEYRGWVGRLGRLTALRQSREALLESERATGRLRLAGQLLAPALGALGRDLCLATDHSRRIVHDLFSGGAAADEIDCHTVEAEASQFIDLVRSDLVAALAPGRPRLVGISVPFWMQLMPALVIARYFRAQVPGIHISLGGPVINLLHAEGHQRLLDLEFVDSVVSGEGEGPLLRLVEGLRQPRPGPAIVATETPAVRAEPGSSSKIDEVALRPGTTYMRIAVPPRETRDTSLWMPVLQSRGCYWGRCAFCSYDCQSPLARYRFRPFDDVVDDIAHYRAQGVRSFNLLADAIPPKHAGRLANEIRRRELDIEWGCFIRADSHFTVDLLRDLRDSGFTTGCVGMESSNDRILRLMNKGYESAQLRTFFDRVREAGLRLGQINVIVDFPSTTYDEAMGVLEFCHQHRDVTRSFSIHNFVLDESSAVGRNPERYGLTVDRESLPRRWNMECNAIAFEDRMGMTEDEKDRAFSLFEQLDRGTRSQEHTCAESDRLLYLLEHEARMAGSSPKSGGGNLERPGSVESSQRLRFPAQSDYSIEAVHFGPNGARVQPSIPALVAAIRDGWTTLSGSSVEALAELAGTTTSIDDLTIRFARRHGALGAIERARGLVRSLARRGLLVRPPRPPDAA